jgi:hypothetical protein
MFAATIDIFRSLAFGLWTFRRQAWYDDLLFALDGIAKIRALLSKNGTIRNGFEDDGIFDGISKKSQ